MKTVLILFFVFLGCISDLAAQMHVRYPLKWAALAQKLVERLDIQKDEKVLLVAYPGLFDEIIPHLRYEIMKRGGVDLGVMDVLQKPLPETWDKTVLQQADNQAREALRNMLQSVDASIMLPGALPSNPVYAAIQDLLREGRGRTVHFHWLAAGSALAIPGQPLPTPELIDATYQNAILQADYEQIRQAQLDFIEAMRQAEVRVTTPAGTDLRFRVGDRPVNIQDGDASAARMKSAKILIDREIELPCGAIRVAPLEQTVNGVIAFPPSQWDGRPVTGLKLRFSEGRIVHLEAESGIEFVEAEMQRGGDAAKQLREFALGFNPLLAVPDKNPWIPYYGYGSGVVRLSLGDNSELGGKVSGGYVRWNFFADATVTVGDRVWVKDGKLVER